MILPYCRLFLILHRLTQHLFQLAFGLLEAFMTTAQEFLVVRIKRRGVVRQEELAKRKEKAEATLIPANMDYRAIPGLSSEVREKLSAIQPLNLGQASRISGVTPAAIAAIEVYLIKLLREASLE